MTLDVATFSKAKATFNFQFVQDLRKQYKRRQSFELAASALGLLGILLMLVENEILMHSTEKKEKMILVLKFIVSCTTFVLDILIIARYYAHTQILKMQNALPPNASMLSTYFGRIFLELLICSYHIPPGITGTFQIHQFDGFASKQAPYCSIQLMYDLTKIDNSCYLVYDYNIEAMGVFMIARIFLFGRYMRSSSSLYSQWVAFIGSLNDVNAMRPFFHFKALFKIKPLHLLIPMTLLNTFLTAAIIRILERPVQGVFASYSKSIWLTAVTITATGFGDYYPVTYLGRAFTTISAIFGGVLLVALVQSIFFGAMELSHKERKVKYLVDIHQWELRNRFHAAHLIQTQWRLFYLSNRDGDSKKTKHLTYHFYDLLRQARTLRKQKPFFELTYEEQLDLLEETLVKQIDEAEKEKMNILERIQKKTIELNALRKKINELI